MSDENKKHVSVAAALSSGKPFFMVESYGKCFYVEAEAVAHAKKEADENSSRFGDVEHQIVLKAVVAFGPPPRPKEETVVKEITIGS